MQGPLLDICITRAGTAMYIRRMWRRNSESAGARQGALDVYKPSLHGCWKKRALENDKGQLFDNIDDVLRRTILLALEVVPPPYSATISPVAGSSDVKATCMESSFHPRTVYMYLAAQRLILLFLINCGNDSVSTCWVSRSAENHPLGRVPYGSVHKITTGRAFHCRPHPKYRDQWSLGIEAFASAGKIHPSSTIRLMTRNAP